MHNLDLQVSNSPFPSLAWVLRDKKEGGMQNSFSEWLQGALQSESQLLCGFPVAGDLLSRCQD